MAVGNTFRITGGARRVTHCGGGTLVDLGPVELDGLLGDQRFVRMHLHAVGSVDAVGRVAGDDDVLDGGELRKLWVEQRQQRRVDDDDLVLGVVRHVDQLLGEESDVEGVQHRAHRRHGQVGLEVFGVVPHEGRHALVAVDAESAQCVCQLCATSSDIGVATTPRAVSGPGHDLGIAVDRAAVAQDLRDLQRCVLHCALHGCSCGSRGSVWWSWVLGRGVTPVTVSIMQNRTGVWSGDPSYVRACGAFGSRADP